jgi:hypothetical protein
MSQAMKQSKLRYLLALVPVVVLIAGFLWYDHRFPTWEEEVVLPDGRKIIVKQKRDFIEGYGTRRTWLTFSLPEMGGKRTWNEYMQPAAISISASQEVYVIGWPSGFNQSAMYSLPRYGYVAFRWNGSKFERVPLMSVPESLREEENVIRCMPDSSFVSWQVKQSFGCDNQNRYTRGASRKIDLAKMQAWAMRNARLSNMTPQSE